MKSRIIAISICSLLLNSAKAQSEGDVQWCLTGDATYTIFQQPSRGYCASVAAGGAIGIWYAPQFATEILTKKQIEWSQVAASLSCLPDAISQQAAVGLIAACQCHNVGAADWVISNPGRVLAVLRKHARC